MDFYSEASSRPFTHGQISWSVNTYTFLVCLKVGIIVYIFYCSYDVGSVAYRYIMRIFYLIRLDYAKIQLHKRVNMTSAIGKKVLTFKYKQKYSKIECRHLYSFLTCQLTRIVSSCYVCVCAQLICFFCR